MIMLENTIPIARAQVVHGNHCSHTHFSVKRSMASEKENQLSKPYATIGPDGK